MAEITKYRKIRPSSRDKEKSKRYKVDTSKISHGDILMVNIDHEAKPFRESYKFRGSDLAHKNSIHFTVKEFGTSIDITWSGATPIA
jgi:hypothetical protein